MRLIPAEYVNDAAFCSSVEMHRVEYGKLSDAKLAKKVRHLRRAVARMTLQRNADLIVALHDVAMAEVKRRLDLQSQRTHAQKQTPE